MPKNAYVLLLLTALFWGGNAVAGKIAVGHVSPMTLTTLRWVFGLLLIAFSQVSRSKLLIELNRSALAKRVIARHQKL